MTKRNINLDSVKTLACFAVIGLHTATLGGIFYNFCGFAIPFFFMASGYMLFQKDQIRIDYVIQKSLRILRLVVFWNIVSLFLQLVRDAAQGNLSIASQVLNLPFDIIKSLLHRGSMAHFWYFGSLILLYCVAWALYAIRLNEVSNKFLAFGVVLAIAFVICLLFQMVSYIVNRPVQKEIYQTFRIWTWLFYAILGSLVRQKIKYIPIGIQTHVSLFCVLSIVAVFYFGWIEKNVIQDGHVEFLYDSLIMMCWTVVFFTLIMRMQLSSRVQIWIETLQPLTLGVFIVHWFIRIVILSVIEVPQEGILWFITLSLLSFFSVFLLKKVPFIKTFLSI